MSTEAPRPAPPEPITRVFLDLDGVLADFTASAARALHADVGAIRRGNFLIWDDWGVSEEEFWRICRGEVFWRNLAWTADGRDILALVEKLVPAPLWLLTSPSDDPGCFSGKYQWVCQHLPQFKRRLVVCADKDLLARPGALLLDDNTHNVEQWLLAGGHGVIVPRRWNHRHDYAALPGGTLKYLAYYLSQLAVQAGVNPPDRSVA